MHLYSFPAGGAINLGANCNGRIHENMHPNLHPIPKVEPHIGLW